MAQMLKVPGLYMYTHAAELLKYNKVQLESVIERGDKTIIWFSVEGSQKYDVRVSIQHVEKNVYLKEWSCTCEHSSFPKGVECSHRIAAQTRLIQLMGWGK